MGGTSCLTSRKAAAVIPEGCVSASPSALVDPHTPGSYSPRTHASYSTPPPWLTVPTAPPLQVVFLTTSCVHGPPATVFGRERMRDPPIYPPCARGSPGTALGCVHARISTTRERSVPASLSASVGPHTPESYSPAHLCGAIHALHQAKQWLDSNRAAAHPLTLRTRSPGCHWLRPEHGLGHT